MPTVGRYVLRRALPPAAIALLAITSTMLVLQLLRLGHHLVGANLGLRHLLGIVALSTPTLLLFALPLAAFCGVLFASVRLRDTNELLAMRSLGCSGLQLALPTILVGSSLGLLGAGAAWCEGRSLARLHREVSQQMARAVVDGIEPGFFVPLVDDIVVYAHDRLPNGRLEGLLIARQGGASLLLASRARIEVQPAPLSLTLDLDGVELQQRKADGKLRRVSMERYRERFDLSAGSRRHFGFLLDRANRAERHHSVVDALLVCAALGLLGLLLGTTSWGRLLVGVAGAATLLGLIGARSLLDAPSAASIVLSAMLAIVALACLRRS